MFISCVVRVRERVRVWVWVRVTVGVMDGDGLLLVYWGYIRLGSGLGLDCVRHRFELECSAHATDGRAGGAFRQAACERACTAKLRSTAARPRGREGIRRLYRVSYRGARGRVSFRVRVGVRVGVRVTVGYRARA